MLEKTYLLLLILCGIFYQGIIAKLSDEDTRDSSNLLVREKRVISHLPGGMIPRRIDEANYVAIIRKNNRHTCTGAILTIHTIIAPDFCFTLSLSHYEIYSGSADERYSNCHTVKSKISHYGNLPHDDFDGIALITVDPPFVFTSKTGNLQLYTGSLPVGTQAVVTGWGVTCPSHPVCNARRRLRTITIRIMDHEECQAIYHGRFPITDKHICTYDACQHCAQADEGVPLVVNNRMAGIYIWKGRDKNLRNPDVFLNLQRADYSEWIRERTMLQGN